MFNFVRIYSGAGARSVTVDHLQPTIFKTNKRQAQATSERAERII